ncbi:xanthine dehydrogenase family protein molybdopterin-binding subunit [Chloroflexota bacterium]
MSELTIVGKSVPRLDALEKVTGEAKYTLDIKLPHMLYGKILRSLYPHARIISIDSSRAEKLPGVRAIVTAADAPAKRHGNFLFDQYTPARDVVRFVGEPIAAVAADSVEIAEEALELIEVQYEELPAVFDPEEAMGIDPPVIIHPDLPKYAKTPVLSPHPEPDRPNVFQHIKVRKGDVEKGFQEADLVIESRFSKPRCHHCALEPHVAVTRVEPDGGLTVWTSTQSIYRVKGELSRLFDIPVSKIRVISSYVGGGFGGKNGIRPEPFATILAMKTGRPVKVAFTREEVFVGTVTEIPMVVYIKDGVKKDGTMVAREMKLILSGGGYADYAPVVVQMCSFGAVGTYRVPNFKLDSYGTYVNEPIGGAYRGLGCQHPEWAVECHMDMIAEKLGIDPVEIRKKNLLREGDENASGEITHSIATRECLEKMAEFIEWGKKPEEDGGPWKRGKGIAVGNKYSLTGAGHCAIVKVHPDATIEVRTGAVEIGQGSDTILAQIAAEEFGVTVKSVVVVSGDTAFTPYDPGQTSSRTTYSTGNAVRLACQDAKRQMFEIASERLKVPVDDLETREGEVLVKGGSRAIAISQLFGTAGTWSGGFLESGAELLGKATWLQHYTPDLADHETGQLDLALAVKGERLVSFYIHGAQAVEVAVNVETGQVKVLKMGSAFDMGQPINPKSCEGQMEGGLGMGIGGALYEEMVMEGGVAVNPTFVDYKIPTIMEVPTGEAVQSMIVPAPHKDGPYGAKGVGEGSLIPTAPAIGNAIYNAVGVRIKDLPITREKVLAALRDAGKI